MRKVEVIEFNWIFVVAYIVYFLSLPILTSFNSEKMGQLGDYFGGHLGAVFGFISLLILLSSYRLQSEAMKITKEEAKNAEELNRKQIDLMLAQAGTFTSDSEFKTFNLYSNLLSNKIESVNFYAMVKHESGSFFYTRTPELRCSGSEAIRELVNAHINSRAKQTYKVNADQFINFLVVFTNVNDWINSLGSSQNRKIFAKVLFDFFGDIINLVLTNKEAFDFIPQKVVERVESAYGELSR